MSVRDNIPALLKWWKELTDNLSEKHKSPYAVYRSRLRRCHHLDDVITTPAFVRLWGSLTEDERHYKRNIEKWAMIAYLCAYIEHDAKESFAYIAGGATAKDKDKEPLVSHLRFEKMQTARNSQEFVLALRRILVLCDDTVSISRLAKDVGVWHFQQAFKKPEKLTESIKFKWADEFYNHSKLEY